MVKAGLYNVYHTTSEHCDPKSYPPQSQSNDTPTLENNFATAPAPNFYQKGEETSD